MDAAERILKKRAEARRLRDVPPETTLAMGFGMMRFARTLREAADRARR